MARRGYDGEWLDDKRQGDGRMAEVSGSTPHRPYVNDKQICDSAVRRRAHFRSPFVNDLQKGPGELTFNGRRIIASSKT
jgi:hypothetical protein